MALSRIRSIKPDFFIDEDIGELSHAARLLFIGLWTLADRCGRLEDRPKRIKIQIFPYDDLDVNPLLNQLAKANFIIRYEVDGQKLISIRNFLKHQRPNARESKSILPPAPRFEEVDTEDLAHAVPDKTPTTPGNARARTDKTVHTRGEREGEREGNQTEGADAPSAPAGARVSESQPVKKKRKSSDVPPIPLAGLLDLWRERLVPPLADLAAGDLTSADRDALRRLWVAAWEIGRAHV